MAPVRQRKLTKRCRQAGARARLTLGAVDGPQARADNHGIGAKNSKKKRASCQRRNGAMRRISQLLLTSAAALALAGLAPSGTNAQQVGAKDIGGVVTGPAGPEAGVWVIAETSDLPTRYMKMVVTDDQGRYLVPDLPKANYRVWVRGYSLADSDKTPAELGKTVNI